MGDRIYVNPECQTIWSRLLFDSLFGNQVEKFIQDVKLLNNPKEYERTIKASDKNKYNVRLRVASSKEAAWGISIESIQIICRDATNSLTKSSQTIS